MFKLLASTTSPSEDFQLQHHQPIGPHQARRYQFQQQQLLSPAAAGVNNINNVPPCSRLVYAVLRDNLGQSAIVCAGATRRTSFESLGHVVEIRLVGSKTALISAGFLVRFDG